MNINHNVALNLSASVTPPTLHMAQGDANSRTIVATLWDGAQIFEIPSGSTCMVRFRKPDGAGGLYDHTEAGGAVSYSGGVVTAPVAAQMLTTAGIVTAEIDIYGSGSTDQEAIKLASFLFLVDVHPSACADAAIMSSDYYNIVAAQIAAAVKAGEKADAAIAAAGVASDAAGTAVNAGASAAQSQAAAESAKDAAVSAADAAVEAGNAAAAAKESAENARGAAESAEEGAGRSAAEAQENAQSAAQDAEDAEAWAVGKRNGVDVASDDPAYHNNAKYYKEQARAAAGGGVMSFNGRGGDVEPQAGDYTKGMVGLGNVDNTSDADKPISNAQQEALDGKQARITASGILKGDGAGGVSAAVKGTDYAAPSVGVTVTLTAAGWDADAKTQTVSVAGVTATANIIITAAPDSYMAYAEAGVRCTAQGAGTLTFACETVPTADVAANVLILG